MSRLIFSLPKFICSKSTLFRWFVGNCIPLTPSHVIPVCQKTSQKLRLSLSPFPYCSRSLEFANESKFIQDLQSRRVEKPCSLRLFAKTQSSFLGAMGPTHSLLSSFPAGSSLISLVLIFLCAPGSAMAVYSLIPTLNALYWYNRVASFLSEPCLIYPLPWVVWLQKLQRLFCWYTVYIVHQIYSWLIAHVL